MPRKRLTEEGVKKLRPLPDKQLLIFDTVMPGLLLNVSYGGAKTWRALHYVNGKPVTFKLGRYPILNLKDARDRARDFLADPDGMRRRANSDTFDGVADDFFKRHVKKNGLRTARDIERKLRVYVRPHWGKRRFTEIRRGDVSKLIDEIEDNHGPSQADAILALLPGMERWTLHDLRRTGRSLMSRAGVSSEIAERVLGHALPGVEGTYNRHDFLEEKSEALQRLADLVAEIVAMRPRVQRARPIREAFA